MWKAYLFHVASGQLGARLAIENSTWGISLNESEELKVTLRKSELPKLDLNLWFDPWYAGIVLIYDDKPIVAGPIISQPTESFDSLHLQCGGIRHLLAKRLAIQEQSDWNTLAKKVVSYRGLSLGTIAKRVVQLVQQKPGGLLPIDFPYADQTAAQDADHERNYRSFNLANISAHSILDKLSGVIDGPDIMFRPKIVNISGSMFLRWDMVYGSEDFPRIPQKTSPEWDTTAVNSPITNMTNTSTGAYQTHRVFAIGAGTDEGTLIRMAQDLSRTAKGYPLLETVYPNSGSENPNVVLQHARGRLAQDKDKLLELSLSVRTDQPPFTLGSYFVGDQIRVIIEDGWVTIPSGSHKARLLAINGGLDHEVKLSVQLEDGN